MGSQAEFEELFHKTLPERLAIFSYLSTCRRWGVGVGRLGLTRSGTSVPGPDTGQMASKYVLLEAPASPGPSMAGLEGGRTGWLWDCLPAAAHVLSSQG